MKKMILAAAATVALVLTVGQSFAGGSSSFGQQSANIQAGGGPAGVAQFVPRQ